MTRKWNSAQTQTGFAGWLRNNPNLDSREHGIVITNSDMWVHRYKTERGRERQYLMLVEIKEFGAQLTDSQKDTLHLVDQLLRGSSEVRVRQVWSTAISKIVSVWCFGAHVLRISGDGTYTQACQLLWDGREISTEQLEQLLRFELDPNDPTRPLD